MEWGPLEAEIRELTRMALPENPKDLSTEDMILALIRNVANLNEAVWRLAGEIDRLRENATPST